MSYKKYDNTEDMKKYIEHMGELSLYNELYFLITEVQRDIIDAKLEDDIRERARIENLKNRLVNHMNRSYKGILDRDVTRR